MIFTSVAPVMAKLLGLFLTAAQIFDNRRDAAKFPGADVRSLIAATEVPIYPSEHFRAGAVRDRIFLFHGDTLTVGTVLVICRRRAGLGDSNGRSLKAFGGKTHGQCRGDQ
jgi:hypothetical protein